MPARKYHRDDPRSCTKCGIRKPADSFAFVNKERGYRRGDCRDCSRSKVRENYRANPEPYKSRALERHRRLNSDPAYRANLRARQAEYESKGDQRIKRNARAKMRYHVKIGNIPPIKARQCNRCPAQAEHYHHHDYSRPLDVEPLCVPCHKRHHHGTPEDMV